MPKPVRISLDAMGGDHGPSVVIPGAGLALERHPDVRFVIFGNEAAIDRSGLFGHVVPVEAANVVVGLGDEAAAELVVAEDADGE